jgi:hypothetical protein
MHGFILKFHNTKFYIVSLVVYVEMKLNGPNASFMGFYFFSETVYTRFHLDETPLLSFLINSLPYHQKIICGISFIENETPIENRLRAYIFYY